MESNIVQQSKARSTHPLPPRPYLSAILWLLLAAGFSEKARGFSLLYGLTPSMFPIPVGQRALQPAKTIRSSLAASWCALAAPKKRQGQGQVRGQGRQQHPSRAPQESQGQRRSSRASSVSPADNEEERDSPRGQETDTEYGSESGSERGWTRAAGARATREAQTDAEGGWQSGAAVPSSAAGARALERGAGTEAQVDAEVGWGRDRDAPSLRDAGGARRTPARTGGGGREEPGGRAAPADGRKWVVVTRPAHRRGQVLHLVCGQRAVDRGGQWAATLRSNTQGGGREEGGGEGGRGKRGGGGGWGGKRVCVCAREFEREKFALERELERERERERERHTSRRPGRNRVGRRPVWSNINQWSNPD